MNVSTINHDDHRTREEYKNKQKQQAFAQIQNIGANLLISGAFTYLLTHSLTHSLTYSLTHSLTHLLTHSLTYLLTN